MEAGQERGRGVLTYVPRVRLRVRVGPGRRAHARSRPRKAVWRCWRVRVVARKRGAMRGRRVGSGGWRLDSADGQLHGYKTKRRRSMHGHQPVDENRDLGPSSGRAAIMNTWPAT